MGVSYQTGTLVRTGEERATLVRRTYSLVLVSVLVTIVGATFGLSQPQLMQAVAQHPFIAFFASLAPLLMATRKKADFPFNIGLVLLFNFVMGVIISPALFIYGRTQPGLIGQAAVLASPMAMATVVASVLKGSAVLPRLLPDHEVQQQRSTSSQY